VAPAAAVVDLTQRLGPETVLWPGSNPFAAENVMELGRDAAYSRDIRLPEHSGTHLDAPAHFAADGDRVDAITADRLVVPAAVLDVRAESEADPDFHLSAQDLARLEARDGAIEPGSAVLLNTGWDRHLGDPAYLGGTGAQDLHFPGFGADAAELLVERGVAGLGIDTLGVDPGVETEYPVHLITLPAGLWHLEGLVNLAELPPRGATLVAGVIRLVDGSGAPARVLALLPDPA
jgi:kynurenine formamidase